MIKKFFYYLRSLLLLKTSLLGGFRQSYANGFGILFFIVIMIIWGMNKINRKKFELIEEKILNNITQTTYLNQWCDPRKVDG